MKGADLSEADYGKILLSGANLHGANLNEADLSGADLRGADLREANLNGANMEYSRVSMNLQNYIFGQNVKGFDKIIFIDE